MSTITFNELGVMKNPRSNMVPLRSNAMAAFTEIAEWSVRPLVGSHVS